MESICNDTLKLLLSNSPYLDLNYQIDGYNLHKFYEVHCGISSSSASNTNNVSTSSSNGPLWNSNLNGTTTSMSTDEDDVEELYEPEYFSHTYRIVGTFFQGIIFLIGLLGNIMVVLVVAKTKSMHSPTNCYLVSLALADIIVLLAAVPNEILSYFLIGGKWLYGELGCSLFVFSQNLGINASTLSLTAFTVERYIAICHPMKAQTMCTVSRAKRIICGVWLCSIVYCSPWLGLTSLTRLPYRGFPDVKKCTFKLSREAYTYYYLTDFFVFYVVPLILSVILYGLIAQILFQSHSIKTNNLSATASAGGIGGGGGGGGGSSSASGGSKSKSSTLNGCSGQLTVDSTKTNAARVQVVKMLVMVVVIFAVLWLPYRGMLVYNSFAPMFNREVFLDLWFLMFVKTCIYINSAINPILYNAMSVKFRRAFSRTLFCGKHSSRSSFKTYYSRAGGGGGVGSKRQGRTTGRDDQYTTYSTATCTTPPFPTSIGTATTITMIPMVDQSGSSTGKTTTSLLSKNHNQQLHSILNNSNSNGNNCYGKQNNNTLLKSNLLKSRSQPRKSSLVKKNGHHHVHYNPDPMDTVYSCSEDENVQLAAAATTASLGSPTTTANCRPAVVTQL